jgi:uracil-DNA glycosylase
VDDDVRSRLRRWLEQRRELGERELVLDRLTSGEARDILADHPAPSPLSSAEPAVHGEPAAVGGWRATLIAAGAAPPQEVATRRPPAPKASPPEESPPLPAGIVVGGNAGDLFGGGGGNGLDTLADVAKAVATCKRCPLSATAKNPVPGEGNPNAQLMLVGEAPGATEDETGRPFVGQAGQLLTKILGAIDMTRDDVFICNVLKHRPPGNRNPLPDEVTACNPWLVRQIELIRPKVLIALGTFAAQTLLDTKLSISKLRGQLHRYYGVPLIVTYHPAALLRNPAWKRPTWEDVQLARRILDRAVTGA